MFFSYRKKVVLRNANVIDLIITENIHLDILSSVGFMDVVLHALHVYPKYIVLDQAWAASGPRSTLMWPASYNFSIIDSLFYIEKHIDIPENL